MRTVKDIQNLSSETLAFIKDWINRDDKTPHTQALTRAVLRMCRFELEIEFTI